MKRSLKYVPILGLMGTLAIIVGVILLAAPPLDAAPSDPWEHVPPRPAHTDHTALIDVPLTTGPEVTALCLTCHEDAGHQVAMTSHFTWRSEPVAVSWSDELISIGKANTINNFCIGIQGNWRTCTSCHAGYGYADNEYDFTNVNNVDCLVCHDQSGQYVKGNYGLPQETVDLVAAAQSVGTPTRANCGGCHFNGGGGNGVKHGDLDQTLYFPSENLDVHMGAYSFECIDCHQTDDHQITGRSISVSVDEANQIACTDCHDLTTHADQRITEHLDSVACQTCHIPQFALDDPTKVEWDWSQAGDPDRPENVHEYLQIKGEFVYESNVVPSYEWYNGTATHYILGQLMDPLLPTSINDPIGSIDDPDALIFPFKIHWAMQPYDSINNILLQPLTSGEGGYWTTFDWDSALRLGAEFAGLDYSGEYGFAETYMYFPTTHMVQPGERALTCTDCHSDNGRMDWEALGYLGDPMVWGGR